MFHPTLFLGFFACLVSVAGAAIRARTDCHADNCLRALQAGAELSDSKAFCSAFIVQAPQLNSAPLPKKVGASFLSTVTSTGLKIQPPSSIRIPSYMSACSGSVRVSSACSCLVSTTAAPTTVLTASNPTIISTTTTTTSTTSTMPNISTAICQSLGPFSQTVNLRIEGSTDTIYEGPITSTPSNVTSPSGGTHVCNGQNNDANANPGATCTTALDEAACQNGFTWHGTFHTSFDDYFITQIGTSAQTSTEFWGLLVNYQFTPVGGCQYEAKENDDVLWAFNASNAVYFLEASSNADFSSTTGEGSVDFPKLIFVRDGTSGVLVRGASIGGAVTDANGVAEVNFNAPGMYTLKAERSDSIRSNAVTIAVGGW